MDGDINAPREELELSTKNFLAFTIIDAGAISNNSGTSFVSMYVPFVLSPRFPVVSCLYSIPRKRTVAPTRMRLVTFGFCTFK